MLYLIIILLANILISLLSAILNGNLLYSFLYTLLATIAIIAIDGIFAFLIRRLPNKWFDENSFLCNVPKFEKKLWKKLHVSKWEKKIPELGMFTGFHKNHIASPNDPNYLKRFLLETNYGAVIHLFNALFGFLIIWIPYTGGLWIQIPVILVNFVLSMLPYAILRHNTAPLKRLIEMKERNNASK